MVTAHFYVPTYLCGFPRRKKTSVSGLWALKQLHFMICADMLVPTLCVEGVCVVPWYECACKMPCICLLLCVGVCVCVCVCVCWWFVTVCFYEGVCTCLSVSEI